jgi:enoyl-CoA hydratase/carnithine racemase
MGLALLADKLLAEKAAEWGLIWEAVADDAFAARIDALAAQQAAMPPRRWCAPARPCTPRRATRWSSSCP